MTSLSKLRKTLDDENEDILVQIQEEQRQFHDVSPGGFIR